MMKDPRNASFAIANIGFKVDHKGFTIVFHDIPAIAPENTSSIQCAVSISSLVRAGLLHTSYVKFRNNDLEYNPIRSGPAYLQMEHMCKPEQNEIFFEKGICELTNLGHEFIQACID